MGGRGCGRRLCAGVAGASREEWWPGWRVPGNAEPLVAGLGLGAGRGPFWALWVGGGRAEGGGAVPGAFWKAAYSR